MAPVTERVVGSRLHQESDAMPDTPQARVAYPGAGAPTAYRVILLRKDGTVVGTVPVSARDDDLAIERAKALADGHAVELWDGLRFIEHFDPIA